MNTTHAAMLMAMETRESVVARENATTIGRIADKTSRRRVRSSKRASVSRSRSDRARSASFCAREVEVSDATANHGPCHLDRWGIPLSSRCRRAG